MILSEDNLPVLCQVSFPFNSGGLLVINFHSLPEIFFPSNRNCLPEYRLTSLSEESVQVRLRQTGGSIPNIHFRVCRKRRVRQRGTSLPNRAFSVCRKASVKLKFWQTGTLRFYSTRSPTGMKAISGISSLKGRCKLGLAVN